MRILLSIVILLYSVAAFSQSKPQISLFNTLDLNTTAAENRGNLIRAFPDGGWVSCSSTQSGTTHNILLVRYDRCGELVFSTRYNTGLDYFRSGDIIVDDQKQILICGYNGKSASESDVFLLKLDSMGNEIWSNIYTNGLANHTYSVGQYSNGDYFINGLTSYPVPNIGYSFLLTVSSSGNIIRAREYVPTVIWGRSAACSDGGVITRTGSTIYKTNSAGNLEWMNSYQSGSYTEKPQEVSDGYVYARYRAVASNRESYLFKLSKSGNLMWVSEVDTIQSVKTISTDAAGNLIAVSSKFINGSNAISIKTISANGVTISENFFAPRGITDDYMVTDHTTAVDGSLLICGYVRRGSQYRFFTAKTKNDLSFNCGQFNSNQVTAATSMNVVSVTPEVRAAAFSVQPLQLQVDSIFAPSEQSCFVLENPPEFDPEAGFLCKGRNVILEAGYPGAAYLWQDGSTEDNFNAEHGGNYWVDISMCGTSSRKIFVLDEDDCNCTVYLPNAFTPNGNGLNEEFAPVFNCEFSSYRFSIFNRWGELVFKSDNSEENWNGTFKGHEAIQGVYVYELKYKSVFGDENKVRGAVTLIK